MSLCPVDPDTLDWPALFALRDRLAQYWHRRQGQRYPVEDYHSAGNLALTLALRSYDPARTASFAHYAAAQLFYAMRHVPREASGIGNATRGRTQPRYHTVPHSPAWWAAYGPTVADPAETLRALVEVTTWLAAYPYPRRVRNLVRVVQGYGYDESAAQEGCTRRAVEHDLLHVRADYRAWTVEQHASNVH